MGKHSFLQPLSTTPVVCRGNEIYEKLGRGGGANFKKICIRNQKRKGRGNVKVIGSCDFFIFIFSLLPMVVTNTVSRKSSLEDLFL